jgi:hypothetical protein
MSSFAREMVDIKVKFEMGERLIAAPEPKRYNYKMPLLPIIKMSYNINSLWCISETEGTTNLEARTHRPCGGYDLYHLTGRRKKHEIYTYTRRSYH